MENLLQRISKVVVYLDDIVISEKSGEEYLQNLNDVLHRLESLGLKLKEKCKCMVPSITYLGYRIDSEASECVFVCELVSCKCLCVHNMCKIQIVIFQVFTSACVNLDKQEIKSS